MATASTPQEERVPISCAGLVRGTIFIEMSATLHDLRSALCELSVDRSLTPQDLKLISKGQVLKDEGGEATLGSLGLKPHSSVLALRTAAAAASRSDPGRSSERVARLVAYLERVTGGRSAASSRLVLEKHDGSSVAMDEQSRKALVTALALHQHGAMVMAKGKHAEALEELLAAEEAAAAVQDSTLLSSIDNVALLLLDIVWCSFKLQDRNRLGVSADRLKRCRAQLTRAYGPDKQRTKELQAGIFSPELRTYLRLEVLEGVVAFHTQEHATARERLAAARSRWQRLQVPQEAVDMLTSMGFTADEAQLALQVAGPENVASAALVATQHRQQAQARAEKQASQDRRMARAQGMGRTAAGHALDSEHLATLADQGYACGLAAEALKQADNDLPAAQAALASEDERAALMLTAARTHTRRGRAVCGQASAASSSSAGGSARQGHLRKRRRSWESAFPLVDEVLVAQLMSLGFQECFAHAALLLHRGQLDPAALTLHNWALRDSDVKAAAEPPPPYGASHGADGSSPGGGSARTARLAGEEGAAPELEGPAARDSSEGEEEAHAAEDKEMEEELAAGLGGAPGVALQQPPDLSEEAAALALHLRLLGMEVPEGMA